MTDEDQKAWDMFAAAAFTGKLPKELGVSLKEWNSLSEDEKWKLAKDVVEKQRKARMG